MKITFLGTRGNHEARSRRHAMHSSARTSYYETEVIVDCGGDWLGKGMEWDVDAIVVTHAHPDHAFGLKEDTPCTVFATKGAWEPMAELWPGSTDWRWHGTLKSWRSPKTAWRSCCDDSRYGLWASAGSRQTASADGSRGLDMRSRHRAE